MAFIGVFVYFQQAGAISGGDFRAGRIIDNAVFTNKDSMSEAMIQDFLVKRGAPCLVNYQSPEPLGSNNYGGNVAASRVIWKSAQLFNINPQVLLVTIQKETGLITRSSCTYTRADGSTGDWRDTATGFDCPDGSPCNPTFFGFSKQVYQASRHFRGFYDNTSPVPPYTPGARSIAFNPNGGCGSSVVNIENRATAALYSYTPYQPNQAALNNLFGTGDGCSAYGNRNFWRDFSLWFGSPLTDGFTLATSFNDNGDPRQWVIHNGIKRHVPNTDILQAWRLDSADLVQMTASYLGSISTVEPLGRVMRPSGELAVYFVDGGARYRFSSVEMMDAWGTGTSQIQDVSAGLGGMPNFSGDLSYVIDAPNDGRVMLMDGGTLRQFGNPSALDAWEGSSRQIALSPAYFNSLAVGSTIDHPRIKDPAGNEYLVSLGTRMPVSGALANMYPWSAQPVSNYTIARMGVLSAQPFVKSVSSPAVYLIDNGAKNHVIDPDLLRAWALPASGVRTVADGFLAGDLIGAGATISDYFGDNGGQLYVMDGAKLPVPASLDAAYRTGHSIYAASSYFISMMSTGSSLNGFIKGRNAPEVYFLDNSGRKYHINSSRRLFLWGGQNAVSVVSDVILTRFMSNGILQSYVSDGSTEYLMNQGLKMPVSAGLKSDWGLGSPQVFTDGTLLRHATFSGLSNEARTDGAYFLIRGGIGYATADANIAEIWAVQDAPSLPIELLTDFLSFQMLTRVAVAPGGTKYVVDTTAFYETGTAQLNNLGLFNHPVTVVDVAGMGRTITTWQNALARVGDSYSVIDFGIRRPITHPIIRDAWTNGGSMPVANVSAAFMSAFGQGSPVERSIKGSGPAIYFVNAYVRRWIRSPDDYARNYAPHSMVSDQLLAVIPPGPDL